MLFPTWANKTKTTNPSSARWQNPLNSCVLVNVGDLFWGHQMWAWMPPGTTNIAQTLVIHCVSAHVHGSHQTSLRTVAPQSLPNTVNSCGFASSADIGMQSGALLGSKKRSPTFTNTWQFMLFPTWAYKTKRQKPLPPGGKTL